MPALPSSLALTTIVDGTQIIAVDHRNNYTSLQATVNALITALSGGTPGQYLSALSPSAIGWTAPPTVTTYRKTTAKTVNSSIAETDLLNGEITLAAGVLGLSGCARFTAWGEILNNNAVSANGPRFKLKLGGTTLIDSNVLNCAWQNVATRGAWRVAVEIMNLGATNSQCVSFEMLYTLGYLGAGGGACLALSTGNGNHWVTPSGNGGINGSTAAAIDSTAAKLLEFTVTLPVSAATMECKLTGALVEVL